MFQLNSSSDLFSCQSLEPRSLCAVQAILTLVPTTSGVVGETDSTTKIVLNITSYSFGAHNTSNIGSGTSGAGVGKATFSKLQITKLLDEFDPTLLTYLTAGKRFASAKLSIMDVNLTLPGAGASAGSGVKIAKTKMVDYQFSTVAVSDINISNSHDSMTPTDDVNFEYGALAVVPKTATPAAIRKFRRLARHAH
jgi:type VI protein secretion system component Hcp